MVAIVFLHFVVLLALLKVVTDDEIELPLLALLAAGGALGIWFVEELLGYLGPGLPQWLTLGLGVLLVPAAVFWYVGLRPVHVALIAAGIAVTSVVFRLVFYFVAFAPYAPATGV